MKRYLTITGLTLLGLLLINLSPAAQMNSDRVQDQIENLRSEIERTGEIIQLAAETVKGSNSREAALLLQKAVEVHQSSNSDFGQKRYQMAAEKTKLARELAQKAIGVARATDENRDTVLRKLEHTKQLLERIGESSSHNVSASLKSLYENARDNLRRAWEFYNAGEYRPAVKLCNQVESALRKLMEQFQRQDRESNFTQRRMEQLRGQLERIQAMVAECSSESATELLAQAKQAMQQSQQFYGGGKMEAARASLQKATRLANRAADECRGNEQFQRIYARLAGQADRLAEQIQPDDSRGRKLLNQVREQLMIAKEASEKGNTEAAAAALRATEMTLKQLHKHLNFSQGR
ncbi:MAG: hypothetical protein P1R58_03120 [bacterium]|nr:hypothetical protein [bacterium]